MVGRWPVVGAVDCDAVVTVRGTDPLVDALSESEHRPGSAESQLVVGRCPGERERPWETSTIVHQRIYVVEEEVQHSQCRLGLNTLSHASF